MRVRSLVVVGTVALVAAAAMWAVIARPALGQGVLRWLPAASAPAIQAWPDPPGKVVELPADFPNNFMNARVYVDAGHGAEGNTGNLSSLCEDEQDFTLALANDLALALEATGRFEARVSRSGGEKVQYPNRTADAAKWGAHAFISLHSDVRGAGESWSPEAGTTCMRSLDAPGFSILWSDEGPEALAGSRRSFAQATAAAMLRSGFPAYDGQEYHDNYKGDDLQPGVFVDRHAAGKRIYVLRKPVMPSIIVETHNAWDPREVARWREPETRRAFFSAMILALARSLPAER